MAHMLARSVGKNDSRYWRSRIFRRADPRGIESAHYTARIQWRGRRHYFALGTANKEAAAAKAATIWRDLVAHGLEVTLAKHKSGAAPEDTLAAATTIGEWITAASEVWDGKPATLLAKYSSSFTRPAKLRFDPLYDSVRDLAEQCCRRRFIFCKNLARVA